MVTQNITRVMMEVISYTKEMVESKVNEALRTSRRVEQLPNDNNHRDNLRRSGAPNAISWADRVRGPLKMTVEMPRNVLSAEEFLPLRGLSGIGKSGGTQTLRRERAWKEHPTPRQQEEDTHTVEHRGNRGEVQTVTILPIQNSNGPPMPLRQKLREDKVVPSRDEKFKPINRLSRSLSSFLKGF